MISAFNMKPSIKGVFTTVIMLNVFAIPIGMINWLIGNGANYMYLCKKPPVNNALLIGEWPLYILALEIMGIIIFMILLAPFKTRKIFR